MMLRAARTVVVFGVILQVTGFAKLLVVAAYFGAGPVLDAYYLAQVIPTFLANLCSGVLQSGFIPSYMTAKAREGEMAAAQLRNVTLTWAATLLAGVAAMLAVSRHAVIDLLWGGIDPVAYGALQAAFALVMWVAPVNGVSDALAMLLNAEGRFALAAAAPTVNAVVSGVVVAIWHDKGIDALVWSLLAGIAAQLLVVVSALRRARIRLRPAFKIPAGLPQTLRLIAIPVLVSSVLANFVPAFLQMIAARAGTGAVSAMGYASRLHNSVVQAIVMSVSVVLLPHFARLLAEQRHEELRLTLERVFCATLLFSLALLALIAVSGPAAVGMLLQRGRFTRADGELVAAIWLALTSGLMGTTWGIFLARYFQAQRRPWVIAILAIISVATNIVLALILLPVSGIIGIALGNSIAYTVIMMLFQILVSRSLGPILNEATRAFAVRALAVNALGGIGAFAWSMALNGAPVVLILAGQALIIVAANLLVVRAPPLSVPVGALWRR